MYLNQWTKNGFDGYIDFKFYIHDKAYHKINTKVNTFLGFYEK